MKRNLRLSLLVITAALQTACGTIATKSNGALGKPYSGTICSATVTELAAPSKALWIAVPFTAIDTVLSAAVDTVLLPADLTATPKNMNECGGCNILMVMPYGLTEHCNNRPLKASTARVPENAKDKK